MSKRDEKKKIVVAEAGSDAALKHNPFGALVGQAVAQAPTASSAPSAEPQKQDAALAAPKSRGRLILRREKKGRGGKTVVIVQGLRASAHLPESEIAKITQHLKQQLGCGGAVERVSNDTEIVIQGDQPARVAELLRAMHFRVDGVTS